MMMTNESIDADRKAFSTAFNSDIEDVPEKSLSQRLDDGEGMKLAVTNQTKAAIKRDVPDDTPPPVEAPAPGAEGSGKDALDKAEAERKTKREKSNKIEVDNSNDFEEQQRKFREAGKKLPAGFN